MGSPGGGTYGVFSSSAFARSSRACRESAGVWAWVAGIESAATANSANHLFTSSPLVEASAAEDTTHGVPPQRLSTREPTRRISLQSTDAPGPVLPLKTA